MLKFINKTKAWININHVIDLIFLLEKIGDRS